MKALVMYASRHGNTRRVAEAIADGIRTFGTVDVVPIDEAPATFSGEEDLVVLGGPTEAHGMTPAVKTYLDGLEFGALNGVPMAAFDTRLEWPRWISGSASAGISHRLQKLGADVVVPQASFIVEGKDPVLKPGELERAKSWGDALARTVRAEVAAAR
ncbi:MAG TPA: flavodoxin domain-containing protein [Candidatus Dormibacteraeota bacterium]|nr:flavodoxin domain-containing protein [Candidatus Dormibacteraeota bacterium]